MLGIEEEGCMHLPHSISHLHVFLVIMWKASWGWDHLQPTPHAPSPVAFLHAQRQWRKTCLQTKVPNSNLCRPQWEWQLSQELDTITPSLTNFSTFPPSELKLSGVHIRSDMLWSSGEERGGDHDPFYRGERLCKQISLPVFCAVQDKKKAKAPVFFCQRQTRAVDQAHGSYYCFYTIQTFSFRPAPCPATWKQYPKCRPAAK